MRAACTIRQPGARFCFNGGLTGSTGGGGAAEAELACADASQKPGGGTGGRGGAASGARTGSACAGAAAGGAAAGAGTGGLLSSQPTMTPGHAFRI